MKRTATILTLALLLTAGAAQAQIFLEDDEYNANRANVGEDMGVIPYHGVTHDQADFVPLGGGIMLLAALGGAYLIGKKRRKAMWEAQSGSADSPLPPS